MVLELCCVFVLLIISLFYTNDNLERCKCSVSLDVKHDKTKTKNKGAS